MKRRARFVILGGGCSGLSLAMALCKHGLADNGIAILEARSHYVRDRAWCSWSIDDSPWKHLVSHQWSSWSVTGHDLAHKIQHVHRSHPALTYQHVRADDFYNHAHTQLAKHSTVSIHTQTPALHIESHPHHVLVHTPHGEWTADVVFDSRPTHWTAEPSIHPHLWQRFLGVEIVSPTPVFDPSHATLMDFSIEPSGDAHFLYVLPFTRDRALVEDTWFTARSISNESHHHAIEHHLRERLGLSRWETVYTESGALPMTTRTFPRNPSPRVYRIGIAGGLARPSTGYAFASIQHDAHAVAQAFASHPLPTLPSPRGERSRWMDGAMLSFLQHAPTQGSQFFTELFSRIEPLRLARFLSDRTSLSDDLALMSQVPVFSLLQQRLFSRPAATP